MPEIVVVNTSPLFYLHKLGLLEALNELYDKIIVPEAVKEGLEKHEAKRWHRGSLAE